MKKALLLSTLIFAFLWVNSYAYEVQEFDIYGNPTDSGNYSYMAPYGGGVDKRIVITDPIGDQGSGPVYGDCIKAGIDLMSGQQVVGQQIHGTFPPTPQSAIACWSWRFDTDKNPGTGYQQYPYLGIEWEILIQNVGGKWGVNKWSQGTGYVNLPNATIKIRPNAAGDIVLVYFNPAEIGSPTSMNWIVWNGYYPTWTDIAPNSTYATWTK